MNLAIAAVGLTINLLGLVEAVGSSRMERRSRAFFIAFFSLLAAYVACNLLGQLVEGRPGAVYGTLLRALIFCESLFSSLLPPMLTGFLLYQSGRADWRRSRLFRAAALIWLAYLAILIYTQFSTVIYCFNAENVYNRGPLYPLLLIPLVFLMALNLIALALKHHALSRDQRIAFTGYLLIPTAALLAQMLFYGLYPAVLGASLAALFMFNYIRREQTERYLQQEAENARLRIDLMLSQIQPHFLANSLGAIARLCRNDPEARAAIDRFSRYLRHNMESLTQTAPIPFAQELEHAQTYLALEQLRFGDELRVEYDLRCTDFLLPTLPLQPLAENAVRHGIRRSETGAGTVTVSTRETETHYEITVADDGAGFDPAAPEASPALPENAGVHVGLTNVRERLRRVCGGELRVESAPGHGCRATIFLPKR